jgi:tyrosine-protein phosphatase SIW14
MRIGLVLILLALGCSPTTLNQGIPNFVQVEPGLWRSGQPTTAAQWSYLKSIGVRHVVKLNFDSEGTDALAIAAGLDVHVLSVQPEGDQDVFDNVLNTFVRPNAAALSEAERVIAEDGGVLVHCTHGQDRTGLVVGEHRVLHDRWSKADAYAEMLKNNFHAELHGLHETWESFAP